MGPKSRLWFLIHYLFIFVKVIFNTWITFLSSRNILSIDYKIWRDKNMCLFYQNRRYMSLCIRLKKRVLWCNGGNKYFFKEIVFGIFLLFLNNGFVVISWALNLFFLLTFKERLNTSLLKGKMAFFNPYFFVFFFTCTNV